MDPSQPGSLYLRSTSTVSLHERFSQVLMKPQTRSIPVTSDPSSLQRRGFLQPARSVKRAVLTLPQRMKQQLRKRRSVWARLGWQPSGFWSFRNKYRWGARPAPTWRRRRNLLRPLGQRRLLQNLTPGRRHVSPTLRRGGATTLKGRGFYRKNVPTKKQLDAQLDEYMSLSRSRLDQDLDDYMSMSRRHLDAQLDDYMLMAGQSTED
ncbi:uncharacterized protein LOC108228733 [Kryptolebias marmoratus]|uniref:uncharacterized protein LOC108228733 n=1 Tax=Kryptolebias marmoratus TaxID=37003 RepID=UPI0007F8F18E|nr:uncharacterized protein LOC108228733 [Kryptolebias marmoratus]XP_037836492.1 uncharacterized protein LOC108228733 [Kryptolebias marmoratus]XP_037836493.1 uncharacterized protein LOC108228733 [Kryptolebias marmoratus]